MSSTGGCGDGLAEVAAGVAALGAAVSAAAAGEAPCPALGPEQWLELRELGNRLAGVSLAALAQLDAAGSVEVSGHASTKAWLRHAARMTPGQASTAVKSARACYGLDPWLPQAGAALAAGATSGEHVAAMVHALAPVRRTDDRQPLDAAAQAENDAVSRCAMAERVLVPLACSHDAWELARVARQITEVIDPHAGDRPERLYDRRWLRVVRTMGGMWDLSGRLDPEGGEILMTALAAAGAPTPPTCGTPPAPDGADGAADGAADAAGTAAGGTSAADAAAAGTATRAATGQDPAWTADPGDPRSYEQRMADAVVDLARLALASDRLPATGGTRPQATIVIDLATLTSGDGAADLGWGSTIPAAAARRWLCNAEISLALIHTLPPTTAGSDGTHGTGPDPGWASAVHDLADNPDRDGENDPDRVNSDGADDDSPWAGGLDPDEASCADRDGRDDGGAGWAGGNGLGLDPRGAGWAGGLDPLLARLLRSIPPALGGPQIRLLDLGRAVRLATPAQRRALALRDRGCVFNGCARPPSWCEAHHWKTRWHDGGLTNLDELCLLCSFHHHLVHDDDWHLDRDKDGRWIATAPNHDWLHRRRARRKAA